MLLRRPARLLVSGCLLLAFFGLYALSNQTAAGQSWENRLLRAHHADGMFPALLGREIPFPPFDLDIPTLIVGTLLAATLATTARRWRTFAVVLVGPAATLLATHLFKEAFGRPDLIHATLDFDVSYPSGHAAIAFGVTAALLLAAPRRWLRWLLPVLVGWSALTAAALQAVGDHRPSEVLGTGLLTPAVFLVLGLVVGERRPARVHPLPRVVIVVTIAALVVASIAGAWNDLPWAIGLYAVVAVLSAGAVGVTAVALRGETRPSRAAAAARSEDLPLARV